MLRVPFDLRRLSPNQTHGMHWAVRRRIRRLSAELIELAYQQAGEPKIAPPVQVTLLVRRGRRIDDDTATSAFKHARDRLVALLGFPSDGPRWYSAERVRYDCGACWKGSEHFEVWIEPRSEEYGD